MELLKYHPHVGMLHNTSDLFSGFATVFDPATATDNNTFIPDASDDDTIDLGSAGQVG